VAVSSPWAIELVLAAFAGGAFGAAVGALQSFALAGLVVVVGELYALAVETVGGTPVVDVTGSIAFGPVLGPHVAFAGGAGAVAYAARKGYLDADFDYHPAKNVTTGLGSRPDVLAVGGVFGVVGHLVTAGAGALAVPVDPVALGVVGSAFAHRLALGYSVIGARPGRLLDMSPFEARTAADGGGSGSGGGGSGRAIDERGHAVEPWLPYQYRWSHVATLGVAMGALGGYVAYVTASPFLAFGISVVALAFLCAGVAEIPVTHHMTLPASTAALALVDAPAAELTPTLVRESLALGPVVVVGVAFGLLGALAGEFLQRVLYAHAETHLDPPAASIVVTSLLLGVLSMVGVLPSAVWVPTPA
jgi:hypothetical protein